MTVEELRNELDSLIAQGMGDTTVRLECDHGQTAMKCNGVEYEYIEEETYMADVIHPDDYAGYESKCPIVLLSSY